MPRRNPIPNWDNQTIAHMEMSPSELNTQLFFLPGVSNQAFCEDIESERLSDFDELAVNQENHLPAQLVTDLSRISLPDYDYLPTSGTLRLQRSPWSRFGNHLLLTNVNSGVSESPRTVVQDSSGKSYCCNYASRFCCCKCCLDCILVVTRLRWILVILALMGAISVIAGITFGVLNITLGNSYLTLSLTFIGLGVLLVFVVGIGWRWSPTNHEPCHALFRINSRNQNSLGNNSGRDSLDTWYGGMLYPEFPYVTPPPSYNATMQQNTCASTQSSISHIVSSALLDNMNADAMSCDSIPPAYPTVGCAPSMHTSIYPSVAYAMSTHSSAFEEEERQNRVKKEKSTDCDSALIPMLCVHG